MKRLVRPRHTNWQHAAIWEHVTSQLASAHVHMDIQGMHVSVWIALSALTVRYRFNGTLKLKIVSKYFLWYILCTLHVRRFRVQWQWLVHDYERVGRIEWVHIRQLWWHAGGAWHWCDFVNHGAPTSHVVYFIQNPDTWDAFMIRHCVCSAYTGGGTSDFPFLGDKRKPPVASKRNLFINSALLYLLLIHYLYVHCRYGVWLPSHDPKPYGFSRIWLFGTKLSCWKPRCK
jgi:hypothetical protein